MSSAESLQRYDAALDRICDEFESAWQAGQTPEILVYLDRCDRDRDSLLVELVALDLEYRWQSHHSEALTLEDYIQRYPELGSIFDLPIDLICQEFSVRQTYGDSVDLQEYIQRFGDRDGQLSPQLIDALRATNPQLINPAGNTGTISSDRMGSTIELRCPHCQTMRRTTQSSLDQGFLCEQCGSQVQVVSNADESLEQLSGRMIGPYRFDQPLGSGSFGTVWKAKDTRLDRWVAIKMPRLGQLTPKELEKVFAEARASAHLRHPAIVGVHDVGFFEDRPFIVNDFVPGMTLANLLQHERLSIEESVALCHRIVAGLIHAHQNGVVHRDLKPANILVTKSRDGLLQPQITDFGLASRESDDVTVTVEGKLLGTPAYMSPEQAVGASHVSDERSDIYSIGVILFELLTGERPFRGNIRMLLHQVIHEPPPRPRRLNNRIATDLETICLKCIEKRPESRYSSAVALSEDLSRFQAGRPILAHPIGPLGQLWRWSRRNQMIAALTATIFFVLVAALGIVTWQWRAAKVSELAARISAETMRQQKYVTDLNLAQRALEGGNAQASIKLLMAQLPQPEQLDLRTFPWYHLWRESHQSETLFRFESAGRGLATSRDGRWIAASDHHGTIKVVDTLSDNIPLQLQHNSTMNAVSFLRPGKELLAGGRLGILCCWDLDTQTVVRSCPTFSAIYDIDVHPNGSQIAVALANGSIAVFNPQLEPLKLILAHRDSVKSIEYSPTGDRLASAALDHQVLIWETDAWTQQKSLPGSNHPANDISWSADGSKLAGVNQAAEILVWETSDWEQQLNVKRSGHACRCVRFTPNGEALLISSGDAQIETLDVRSGSQLESYSGHLAAVSQIVVRGNQNRFVSSGDDGSVRSWRFLQDQRNAMVTTNVAAFKSVAFSPDNAILAAAGYQGTIALFDPQSMVPIRELPIEGDRSYSVAFGRADQVASAHESGVIRLWNAATGQQQRSFSLNGQTPLCTKLSADGKLLWASFKNGMICSWNTDSGAVFSKWKAHPKTIFSFDLSPDGRTIATSGFDGTVRLWNLDGSQKFHVLETDKKHIYGIRWSHHGKWLAVARGDHVVEIWNPRTNQSVARLVGHIDSVNVPAFSPDDLILATGSWDSTIRLWDLRTFSEIIVLPGHSNGVDFSPDGTLLASACSRPPYIAIFRSSQPTETELATTQATPR